MKNEEEKIPAPLDPITEADVKTLLGILGKERTRQLLVSINEARAANQETEKEWIGEDAESIR